MWIFLVGINADPNTRFGLCNDSFCVGIFMSNNYHVCTKITCEMAVLLSYSLSAIRKANFVEPEDARLLYHPASSSHKLFLLFACFRLYI